MKENPRRIPWFRQMTVLLLILCLAMSLACAEGAETSQQDIVLKDFTVATADGGTFTLSEALKEKDLALINLWATWCGPCEAEFPFLQQAWEAYQDRVAVVALSVDPRDTAKIIGAYGRERGLSFPMGNDAETGLADLFQVMFIPTTVIVDKTGKVLLTEVGTKTSVEAFTTMFDQLLPERESGAE